jgi:two-component system cell cycle response regulator DivK
MSLPRALIVDDNAINIELVSFVLEAGGFCVAAAGDAAQAIEQVERFKPQLVLMDIQLPGVDGLTLTRQLKADPATRQIVIIAFTAYAMKGDAPKMRAAGCDGYLSKPINVASFAAQVRDYLRLGAQPLAADGVA